MSNHITLIGRESNPFPRHNIALDANGVARYTDLPKSLIALLWQHVSDTPDVEAVVELNGERLTYRQLLDRSAEIAGGLRDSGLQPGQRVANTHPAGVSWVLAYWGVLMAGGISVAVNTRLTPREIDYILRDAGVVRELGPNHPFPKGPPFVIEDVAPDAVVTLFYTSGTTGHPKGVPFSHENLLTSSRNIVDALRIQAASPSEIRTLISVPLFHVTGCNTQMMVAAFLGGTSVILPQFDRNRFIAAINDERINFIITVPAIYALLVRAPEFLVIDRTAVRWVAYGGAPIAPSLVQQLQQVFPRAAMANGFGMTETTSIIATLPNEEAVEHADSIGYAVPTIDLGIVALEGDPRVGELVARGGNVTAGYWGKPEETAQAFRDGWYYTGDIVRVDDSGRLFLVDRKKDIIIRGGENVSSVEVEAVLLELPEVMEAAVLAVPDEVLGEKVGAVVYTGDRQITQEAILSHCESRLARYKKPQFIYFSPTLLPRSAAGKVLKKDLRSRVTWGAEIISSGR